MDSIFTQTGSSLLRSYSPVWTTSLQTITCEFLQMISAFSSVKPGITGNGNPFSKCKFKYGKKTVSITVDIAACKDFQNLVSFILDYAKNRVINAIIKCYRSYDLVLSYVLCNVNRKIFQNTCLKKYFKLFQSNDLNLCWSLHPSNRSGRLDRTLMVKYLSLSHMVKWVKKNPTNPFGVCK